MRNILLTSLLLLSAISYSQTQHKVVAPKQDSANTKSGWRYGKDTDQMTSDIYYTANLTSDGKTYPPSTAKYPVVLTIENYGGTNVVGFSLAKDGEFERKSGDSIVLLIRFDEEKAQHHTFTIASKLKADGIYIDYASANKFIDKIKRVKKLRISFNLSTDEVEAVGFDVDNFHWSHTGSEKRKKAPVHK